MKKIVMMAVIASAAFSACAQKLDASKVPTAVKIPLQRNTLLLLRNGKKKTGSMK